MSEARSARGTHYAPPPFDWSGNPQAQENRRVKAEKITEWCRENGVEADLDDISPRERRRIARSLGYSSVSDETWSLVVAGCRLRRDQEWQQRNLPPSSL